MSLMKALAKAAIGIALAKGVGGMMSGGTARGGTPGNGGAAGGGSPYGGPVSRGSAAGGGDLVDVLGKMLGGSGPRGRGSLGGALEELSQISTDSFSRPDGPNAMSRPFEAPKRGSFGDVLNQSLDHYGEPQTTPTAQQEEFAGVLLRALIQAAKADGRIDAGEKEQLMKHLGDLDRSEVDFVNAELAKPVDVAGLARDVPSGAAAQVYTMSVMGIDLDTNKEARYLQELSQALGMSPGAVNAIHERLGEPLLFR
jgi:hypothetical protein